MIDVIIPTRNRANSLKKVLPTYLRQKYLNKIIIIDDASDENNRRELENLLKIDKRIIYKRFEKQIFLPQARNEGINLSTAEHIFMGEDDVYLEDNHLEILLDLMNKYNADLIAGRRIYIKENQNFEEAKKEADKDKRSIFTRFPLEGYFERYFEEEILDPLFLHSNVLVKRKVYENVLYDPWYRGNSFREDLDFFLRVSELGFKMVLTNKTSCFHIKDSINKKGGARMKRLIYEYYVWKNTFYCFYKNSRILRKKLNIKFPLLHAFLSLILRYPYALYRRIIWKIHQRKKF
ncbi:MAG: glycosyltransferase family 2 protein [Candidatus Aenigmatarchaeota archaeon]